MREFEEDGNNLLLRMMIHREQWLQGVWTMLSSGTALPESSAYRERKLVVGNERLNAGVTFI